MLSLLTRMMRGARVSPAETTHSVGGVCAIIDDVLAS